MPELATIHHLGLVVVNVLRGVYSQPGLYLGAAILLLLEWCFPACPTQRIFRVGLVQDFLWLGVQTLSHVFVLAAWVGVLTAFYQAFLSGLTIHGVERLPTLAKWALCILAIDLLDRCHHRVKDEVPWLWHFHAVHHS
jgi:sterol desaturase/sphingolipid hydroxylase (fatty acid hydroxylase superfamily)